jgi:hypothetical protein
MISKTYLQGGNHKHPLKALSFLKRGYTLFYAGAPFALNATQQLAPRKNALTARVRRCATLPLAAVGITVPSEA